MNPINSLGGNQPIAKASAHAPGGRAESPPAEFVSRSPDRLDLSGVQNYMQVLRQNDIRTEKVAEVRAQLDAGTYETDEKLDIAIDRLIDDL